MGTPPPIREIERKSNALGTVEAALVTRETNATVPTPTEIYLLPFGEEVSGQPVFRADRVQNFQMDWESNSVLVLTADQARVFIAEQSSEVGQQFDGGHSIHLRLQIKNKIEP